MFHILKDINILGKIWSMIRFPYVLPKKLEKSVVGILKIYVVKEVMGDIFSIQYSKFKQISLVV